MELQEQQIALLRERVLRLEGGGDDTGLAKASTGNSSVDDFSIKVRPSATFVLSVLLLNDLYLVERRRQSRAVDQSVGRRYGQNPSRHSQCSQGRGPRRYFREAPTCRQYTSPTWCRPGSPASCNERSSFGRHNQLSPCHQFE